MAKRIWNLSLKEVSRISHMFMVEKPVPYVIYKQVVLSNIMNVNVDNEENIINKYNLYITRYFFVKENKIGAKLTKASHLGFYGKNSIHEQYYIDRGWSIEKTKDFLYKRQGTIKLENIAKSKNISLEEAKKIQKDRTDIIQDKVRNHPDIKTINKNKGKSRTVQFYVDKGHTLEEATLILRKIQIDATANVDFTLKDRYANQIGYWLKIGLSNKEASEKVKSILNTFSLESCIKKHGIKKGTFIWKDKTIKWKKTMNNKSDDEIYQIRLKTIGNGTKFYSNAAFALFSKIEQSLKDDGVILCCQYGNNELRLKYKHSFFLFDFYIKEVNLIIEYNGSHVHPDKDRLTEEQWKNWRHVFNKKTADDCYERDRNKINFAKELGYKVIEIWDHELKSDPNLTLKIKNIIKHELDRNKHEK